ncbi:MAG: 50S ribosomal protein L9 [Parcubacteria group bacterium ADurb.Bin247]|nr:MAG: 50S ribosomal protein L9 [Parcubacteria group bacterium ADurb.Bin247]
MKVILLEDVEKLGKRLDIKNVKKGHARNFLLPKNLARVATKEALKWRDVQIEIKKSVDDTKLKEVQSVVSKMDGLELFFKVKIGEKGQLFESLSAQKIKDKLEEAGFNVSKNQIDLAEPIKELGEFPVKVKFDHNLESIVKIIIMEEK